MLENMIKDLEREKFKNDLSNNQTTFTIANDKKEVALTILLGKGSNSKWKILDL